MKAQAFLKKIDRYRKAFYDIKNYKHLSISKIKKASKNLTKLKNVWGLKSFMVVLMLLIMMILIIMMIIMILMMINTEKLEALEHYLKSLIEIITNQ